MECLGEQDLTVSVQKLAERRTGRDLDRGDGLGVADRHHVVGDYPVAEALEVPGDVRGPREDVDEGPAAYRTTLEDGLDLGEEPALVPDQPHRDYGIPPDSPKSGPKERPEERPI